MIKYYLNKIEIFRIFRQNFIEISVFRKAEISTETEFSIHGATISTEY